MRRLFPHPLISGALFVMWMLLNQTVSPGPALVGIVVAALGGWALDLLQPPPLRIRRPMIALKLLGHVLVDVAQSNLGVARVIFGQRKDRRTGFIRVQLALRDPRPLALLACILTATPGTAWVEFDEEDGWLLLHVLDLVDEATWVSIIRERYEQPLMEIFP
ncbi:Na+/H+ antiporter subunit E [Roseomonas marmotae]|uniref:Na+/H+ antiporter subunit E n=1 Tax=Roseomonas marmotae TaxID=2768161 RepID=A0ABS3KAW8_9PROT|nr:Na+/H+ antiporter subunit E [Roseomonas marmotae]MBO1074587.1 Na+/H+ antiporter subunit E [Roseomonas marmotae]QTI81615.1 Na+/H+ antiporter subunit E [Roseomonas marmotae]